MTKAIKITLLYWLRQSLRAFCPHSNNVSSWHCHAPVCSTCMLRVRIDNRLSALCGMQAIYQLRKCELCHDPLSDEESGLGFDVHQACADREQALADQAA